MRPCVFAMLGGRVARQLQRLRAPCTSARTLRAMFGAASFEKGRCM